MFLNSVSLQNFRNYQKKAFEFVGLTTLVVGPNTSGKTNLLEAIYLLATGKSFRAEIDVEMIKSGEEITRVLGMVSDGGRAALAKTDLEIILTTGLVAGRRVAKKKYQVNGVGKRMIDFVGRLRAVYFGPEDLQLVTDSPSLRRKYLDMVLSQVNREYRRASLSYEKGVRQRNRVLEEIQRYRDIEIQREEIKRRLYFWDQLLIKNGNYITEKREEFVEFVSARRGKPVGLKILNPTGWARPPASSLAGEVGRGIGEQTGSQFQLEYIKSVISPAALGENFQREVILGQTLVGPHRDDIKFKLKIKNEKSKMIDRDLSIYGSRGEQRLVVLWLKMGELEFIAKKTEERPVLLLDDIFSELDRENIRLVGRIGLIGRQQMIITTTEEEIVERNEREKMQVVHLN